MNNYGLIFNNLWWLEEGCQVSNICDYNQILRMATRLV